MSGGVFFDGGVPPRSELALVPALLVNRRSVSASPPVPFLLVYCQDHQGERVNWLWRLHREPRLSPR